MHNSDYLIECKDFHSYLLNSGKITLDEIPQYVRMIEGNRLYIAGYKETAYRHIKEHDALPWLTDFFKIVNDDCLSVEKYKSLDPIQKYGEMIYIMESLLEDVGFDYGKNTRTAVESTLEETVLRAVRAFRNTRQADIRADIAERISEQST